MEELNLAELLKNTPKGTELYSPICGECKLIEALNIDSVTAIKVQTENGNVWSFAKNGHYSKEGGECLLFPSKNNRNWSTFKIEDNSLKVGDHIMREKTGEIFILTQIKQSEEGFWVEKINCSQDSYSIYVSVDEFGKYKKVEKFRPEWLKPFDRVLVRSGKATWEAALFSHLSNLGSATTNGFNYSYCIPYNEETKHLVRTSDEEPEFYKI